MKKSLYSLMLMDNVVDRIDRLAHARGTSRSGLINQILADYVSVQTPEQRIRQIFSCIEDVLEPERFVPFPAPNAMTLARKSSLAYKYRPTVRYEIAMRREMQNGVFGTLTVVFRTQSTELLQKIRDFCTLLVRLERACLPQEQSAQIQYAYEDGKFTRTLYFLQENGWNTERLSRAISDYIRLFDTLLKEYLDVGSEEQTALHYRKWLADGALPV